MEGWDAVKALLVSATVLLFIGFLFGVSAQRSQFWQHPPRSPERLRLLGPAIACHLIAVILLVLAIVA